MATGNDKPKFVSGVVENPFSPWMAVEKHLRKFGHLPNTMECDDKGTCLEKYPELKKTTPKATNQSK